jgi:DNA-binding transcriptional LysR family regulator
MNLETLALYCEVIRSGSFSLGAVAHHVSQSAASQSIRQLEGELGITLIDRTKRPFMVTPEGRKFFDACQSIIEQFEKAKGEITNQRELLGGVVRVAVIYSVGLQDMGFYTQQFNTHYSQAKIRMAFLHPHEVVEAVVNDEADIGILSFPTAHRSLKVIPWHDEPMVFVCHRLHALARKKVVGARDLAEEKFIAFEKNLAIRKAIDRALRQRGVKPEVAMEFDNIETIKQAITIQSGVSILPRSSVSREISNHILAAVPLDMGELVRPIGIIHRKQKLLTPITRKLIEFLQNVER